MCVCLPVPLYNEFGGGVVVWVKHVRRIGECQGGIEVPEILGT